MTPRGIYLCDGSDEEADEIIHKLIERGTLTKLRKFKNRLAFQSSLLMMLAKVLI